MKNSIFKDYIKRMIRNEAFVSVAIVFVLALGIIGTSYALYMDVDTDTDYQIVKVGDLSIGFDNGDNTINLSNMTPTDDDIAVTLSDNVYSFYIYNTGTYTTNYTIKLEPVTDGETPNEVEPEYINYQICKDNIDNCSEIKNLSAGTTIYKDELLPKKTGDVSNPSAYYFLRMWIKSDYTQTDSKTIKYKVFVEAKNSSGAFDSNKTLAYALLNDERVLLNESIPDFAVNAYDELGLFKAEDDYGVSYYYRGSQSNNYVKFGAYNEDIFYYENTWTGNKYDTLEECINNGEWSESECAKRVIAEKGTEFIWRVVRINGDGTIRLIYDGIEAIRDGGMENITSIASTTYSPGSYPFEHGYTYGSDQSPEMENLDLTDSGVKDAVDSWYEIALQDYEEYLSDTVFCNDRSGLISMRIENSKPSLKCVNKNDRFTVDDETIGNGYLEHPIAIITVDELVMAGASPVDTSNSSFYLYSGETIWTMSPSHADYLMPYMYVFDYDIINTVSVDTTSNFEQPVGVRPVINLKADVLKADGDGTYLSPYTIKLS